MFLTFLSYCYLLSLFSTLSNFFAPFFLKMSLCSEMWLGCSFKYLVLVEIPYVLLADPRLLHMQWISCDSLCLFEIHQFFLSLSAKMHMQTCWLKALWLWLKQYFIWHRQTYIQFTMANSISRGSERKPYAYRVHFLFPFWL